MVSKAFSWSACGIESSSAAPPAVMPLMRASAEPKFSAKPKIRSSRRSETSAYLIDEDPQLITNTDVDTFLYPNSN